VEKRKWTALPIKPNAIKKMTAAAFLISTGLVLGYLESLLPALAVIPGGKLGIANVATLLAFSWLGPLYALLIGLLRCLLSAVFGSGISAFLYSGTGTLLSVSAMALCAFLSKKRVGVVGRSIFGAFFFNVGQVSVASFAVSNIRIFSYLPVLTFVSTFCGILTGYITKKIMEAEYVRKK